MTIGPLPVMVRELRRAAVLREAPARSDGELLEWFVTSGEEAAFEALVRRHGPLVLGLCRRILRHGQDAEDAFQATFVVLMRRAGSIVKREMLASWLYGVAYRIAVRARALAARRRTQQRDYQESRPQHFIPSEPDHELTELLDQEVSRLPARYREPLVLCELQGRSRKDAAAELGLNEGTLSSRLARARDLLRQRLQRRGVNVGAAALAAVLAPAAATAAVSPALVAASVQSALVGTGGVAGVLSARVAWLAHAALKGLLLTRLKLGLLLLVAFGLLGTLGVGGLLATRGPQPVPALVQAAAPAPLNPSAPEDAAAAEDADPEDAEADPNAPEEVRPDPARPDAGPRAHRSSCEGRLKSRKQAQHAALLRKVKAAHAARARARAECQAHGKDHDRKGRREP